MPWNKITFALLEVRRKYSSKTYTLWIIEISHATNMPHPLIQQRRLIALNNDWQDLVDECAKDEHRLEENVQVFVQNEFDFCLFAPVLSRWPKLTLIDRCLPEPDIDVLQDTLQAAGAPMADYECQWAVFPTDIEYQYWKTAIRLVKLLRRADKARPQDDHLDEVFKSINSHLHLGEVTASFNGDPLQVKTALKTLQVVLRLLQSAERLCKGLYVENKGGAEEGSS